MTKSYWFRWTLLVIMTETTGTDYQQRYHGSRMSAIQLEACGETSIGQSQDTNIATDKLLKSLSPLINSMRIFGLYFSRPVRVGPPATATKEANRCCGFERLTQSCWHSGRIYATVLFVVTHIVVVAAVIRFSSSPSICSHLAQRSSTFHTLRRQRNPRRGPVRETCVNLKRSPDRNLADGILRRKSHANVRMAQNDDVIRQKI